MKPHRSSDPQPGFGLVAWLEDTRIALPLKGVECRFDVTGPVASVEIDQIYHQNAAIPLDCTYTFPLPSGAAVYRCELHVNGRIIRAKVEAKEDARRIFAAQKAAGRRAALVETERENLFTLSLGNVQPGDLIVVRFAWFQVLDRAAEGLRLRVPTCPGVRYIPGTPLLRASLGRGTADDTDQVPDASRITPPRIDALHPDAAYFSIEGHLASSEVESGSASSPTHAIYVREKAADVTVELSSHGAVPDRDFVLAWREPVAAALVPRAWHWTERHGTYALVQLRAPADVQVAEHYSQDFYFLVDRSGSMQGAKWQRTCDALHAFVRLLGTEDRVWITLFESDFRDFAEAPQPASQVLADRGFQKLVSLGVAGGTELLPAAQHVLRQIDRHSAERRATVVLITDGEVGNEAEIQAAFRKARGVTVHTFGIDTAVNDAFLQALARQQRGGCWLQTPNDDIAGTIAALGDRLRRPVLTELAIAAPWENGGDTLPDLHAREVAALALRSPTAECTIAITGRLPDGREHHFDIDASAAGSEAIKLLWARERITALLGADRQADAIAIAREHNLICEGAAFIAWDEAEQVPIAEEHVVQPSMAYDMIDARPKELLRMSYCLDAASDSVGEFAPPRSSAGGYFRDAELPAAIGHRLAEARTVLDRWASSKEWLDGIITSVSGINDDAWERANALVIAGEWLEQVMSACPDDGQFPRYHEALLRGIFSAVNGSADDLLLWAQAGVDYFRMSRVCEILQKAGTPREIIDHLLAWACATGTIDLKRLTILESLAPALVRQPFSAEPVANVWKRFLAMTPDLTDEIKELVAQAPTEA